MDDGFQIRYPYSIDLSIPLPSPSHPPIIEDEPNNVLSKGWAEMIRKVYEIDPLLCPRCGDWIRVNSFIEKPKVIDRIISHLELTFAAERPPPPQIL